MRRRVKDTGGQGGWVWAVRIIAAGGMGGLLVALLQAPVASRARAGAGGSVVERISVATDGSQGDDRSLQPATNADATVVAFKSYARNLVDDDTTEFVDIFVRDRANATTARVSESDIPGQQANGNSFPPALDAAGRFVAFASEAFNILRGDFNSGADVFVYDREEATTAVLSLVADGRGGGGAPDLAPSITADGSLVAFTSSADDLVPQSDQNETKDVFVRQRSGQGPIELISVATFGARAGRSGEGASAGPAISADTGCVVAFYSDARLVVEDTNAFRDVFVRDRCAGATELVSVSSDGERGNRPSQAAGFSVAVSADGRYVAFSSDASNLVEGDDNNATDIFVRDREAHTTTRVSRALDGGSPSGPSQFPSISGDGRFVVFQSSASNLVENDTNGKTDVFVADMSRGEIRRVSLTDAGDEANGDSTSPQISADGSSVVFQSNASNLVLDDTNDVSDVFAASNPLAGPLPEVTETPTEEMSPTSTETPPSTPTVTATPTATGGTAGPSVTPTTTVAPSATPTPPATGTMTTIVTRTAPPPTVTRTPTGGAVSTATRTAGTGGGGGGGGGGCSCRIDGGRNAPTDGGAAAALALPLLAWVCRGRARRRRR